MENPKQLRRMLRQARRTVRHSAVATGKSPAADARAIRLALRLRQAPAHQP